MRAPLSTPANTGVPGRSWSTTQPRRSRLLHASAANRATWFTRISVA